MNVQVATRVPKEIKEEAERVLDEYGLDLPTVLRSIITITAKQHINPIAFQVPNLARDAQQKERLENIMLKRRNSINYKEPVVFKSNKNGGLIGSVDDMDENMREAWVFERV